MTTTVLIVDDDADIRDMMRMFLETDGYRVIAAADGQDALQQLQRARPGVVVLDLTMPDMDGEEFLERMRDSLCKNTGGHHVGPRLQPR